MIQNEQEDSNSTMLASASLIVTAEDTALGEQLGALLIRSGVKDVSLVRPSALRSYKLDRLLSSQNRLLIWLGLGSEKEQHVHEMARSCADAEVPWLRATFDEHAARADVGPIFLTSCYTCFSALHLPRRKVAIDQLLSASPALRRHWIAIVALRAIRYLSGESHSAPETVVRFAIPDWQSSKLYAICLPGCDSYADRTFSGGLDATRCNEAVLFELYLALSSRESVPNDSGNVQDKYRRTLTRQNRFAHCSTLPLKSSDIKLRGDVHALLCNADPTEDLPLSKTHLSLLLQLSAGLRRRDINHTQPRRWAASAGNLGSVELFLLVRNISELAPGIYYYQAAGHKLVRLQWRRAFPDVQLIFDQLLSGKRTADAIVVFTSAFARLYRKYKYFGYKLTQLDAGVAASQLQLVATALGVHSTLAPSWPDDQIAELCRLTEGEEHVTGLMTLSRNTRQTHSEPATAIRQDGDRGLPLATLSGLTLGELYDFVYRSSRLSLEEFKRKHEDTASVVTPRTNVPQVVGPTRPLPATLLHRKSTRSFSSEPIDINSLSVVIYTATASDIFNEQNGLSPLLSLYLSAKRVLGLDAGIYKVDFSSHTLKPVGALPSTTDEQKIFRGEDYTSSAAFLWIAGNLEAACDLEGSFGHRKLLIRAGALANRLLLSAIALHLEGALIAGVDDGPHSSSFGIKATGKVSLVSVLLGKAIHEN